MAGRGRDSSSRPTHYIAITAQVGKGKYQKGPYVGLWEGEERDDGPLFRGSAKGKYLDEIFDFIKDYGEESISFAIFESRGDKGSRNRRNRDEDDQDAAPRGRGRSSSKRGRDEDEKEDRSRSSRGRGDSDRGRGRSRDEEKDSRGGKKGDWWDD